MVTPRKILINGSYAPSLINFRGHLIKQLVAGGYEVHVAAPDIGNEIAEKLAYMGTKVHQIKLQRTGLGVFADVKYFFQLRRLMRQIDAKFVLNYTIKPNIYGSLAAHSLGIQSASMITGLGYAFYDRNGFAHGVVQTISKWLYRLASAANKVVIFQNPDDRADFIQAGRLSDPSKAKIVNGSGVDVDHYSMAKLPDGPIFLIISRLLVSKGLREYAQAAKKVMAKRPNCKFFIAGFLDDGPDGIGPNELDDWIAEGIEFLGQLDDVRPAIKSCSVYVLPSYREGTPRTVLEASAMGRASIVTDAPGCREVVVGGTTGILVPPRDSNQLAEAMLKFADSPKLRSEMGVEANKFCREKYAVEKVNRSLIRYLGL